MIETQAICVVAIIFVSAFFASTFGFGMGLVSMPLLAFILDVKTATPLIALILLTISLLIFVKNWREVAFKHIKKVIIGNMVGIPVGLYLLKGTDDSIMKGVLALMIILFSLYSLMGRVKLTLNAEWPSYFVGILSGILGTAYNMGGPPVIIYSALKKWPPVTFRSTIQGLVLPTVLMAIISHAMAGLITETVINYYALSFPVVIFSIIVGGKLNRRIPPSRFHNLIHVFLLLIGTSLLIKVFWSL